MDLPQRQRLDRPPQEPVHEFARLQQGPPPYTAFPAQGTQSIAQEVLVGEEIKGSKPLLGLMDVFGGFCHKRSFVWRGGLTTKYGQKNVGAHVELSIAIH